MQGTFELLSLTLTTDALGTTCYVNSDLQLHRDYGPAVIYADGDWIWYWRGMSHRIGGEATIWGTYYLFGKPLSKEVYELECINKTISQWNEYDEDIRLIDQ